MTYLASITDTYESIREQLGFDLVTPGFVEVVFALGVSFGLNLIIGTLYKATYRGTRYSQDYVHTLVIVGTVTTILILVVGSHPNASAIGFGMFAASSLWMPPTARIVMTSSKMADCLTPQMLRPVKRR